MYVWHFTPNFSGFHSTAFFAIIATKNKGQGSSMDTSTFDPYLYLGLTIGKCHGILAIKGLRRYYGNYT